MRVSCSLILISALVGSAHADGDALVDTLHPREIAVGEAMRGGATGTSAIGLNPAGLPMNRELVFEGGYGYRSSDEASLFSVAACDSTNAAPGCFYYNYAGADPNLGGMSMHRRTHVGGATVAYPVSPRVFLGSGVKYFNFKDEAMPDESSSGFSWDVGITLRLTDLISVGGAGYNLWGADSIELPRAAGGGILIRPTPTFTASFDARWKLEDNDKTMRYGGGAELMVRAGSAAIPVRVGGLRDNGLDATYVSAGLGYAALKGGIDVTGRFAVSGPETTMIIASLRLYGPRIANDQ
jgi:hypothetical protein